MTPKPAAPTRRKSEWIVIPPTSFGTGEITIRRDAILGYEDKGGQVILFTPSGPIDLHVNVQRDSFITQWRQP